MIRIFAGTFHQAKYLAQRLELKRSEWEYVGKPDALRGLKPCIVLVYGTVRYRRDHDEIMYMIRDRECHAIEVPERGAIPENVLKAIGRA